MTGPVPESSEAESTVSLPEPVAFPPHQHHLGEEEPMLTGRVTDPSGQPLPGAAITVTDLHGHRPQ